MRSTPQDVNDNRASHSEQFMCGGNRPQLPYEDPSPLSRIKPWLSTSLSVKAGPAMLEIFAVNYNHLAV
jgi:hypothetical protein